ncbi:hypothetical protein QYE76_006400 [Lolium multiflorum]|uniref:Translocon Sec61/SecY plug domain-containing protein n=1 Tax=Lolium multiflorum TaxID=4521 RepID=A0AAD8W1N4_LOLMU|nr:hypothetical protein QYE76_006400 [Lolium multiflorum]
MRGINLFRLRPLAEFLPEVQSPAEDVPFRRKLVYTAGSLVVFFAGSQLRLYGVDTTMAADDPLFWAHTAYAGNFGTVMSLGVFPLVVLEMATHILLGLRVVNPAVENHIILNGLQKLLGVLISVVMPLGIGLSATHLGMGSAILASLQISVGSIVVIYIDEVLRKGYGLLSAIPLFTTANICATIFWKALRAGVHGKLAQTIAFFLLVLNLQGYRVPLPVRRRPRSPDQETRFQTNHYINISYLAYAPILFQATIVSSTYLFSQHLYMDFGENKLVVNLLGKWQPSKGFGGFIPVGGIAYYLTTPPTLADVARDPVHACLYAALLLFGCGLVSMAWFRLCIHSRPYMNRLIGDQVSVTPAQADSIPLSQWARRVFMVAFVVGFCVGVLTLLAGFMGVIGSGTGIMLAVTVMHSYFDSGASSGIGPIGL